MAYTWAGNLSSCERSRLHGVYLSETLFINYQKTSVCTGQVASGHNPKMKTSWLKRLTKTLQQVMHTAMEMMHQRIQRRHILWSSMADELPTELPTGWSDVVEGAFSIPNLADVASLDPVTKNGDDALLDSVIKEGTSVWDLLAEDGSPSGSKVRFSVRVRLLHLSNHLNRGELAEKAAIGDAEKSTSGDVDKPCEGEVDLGEVDLNDVEAEAEACMICVRVRCCILTTGSSERILVLFVKNNRCCVQGKRFDCGFETARSTSDDLNTSGDHLNLFVFDCCGFCSCSIVAFE